MAANIFGRWGRKVPTASFERPQSICLYSGGFPTGGFRYQQRQRPLSELGQQTGTLVRCPFVKAPALPASLCLLLCLPPPASLFGLSKFLVGSVTGTPGWPSLFLISMFLIRSAQDSLES